MQINEFLCAELKINWAPIQSSGLDLVSTKSDLILDLCKSVGADEYLSGPLGRNYLNVEGFKNSNINVVYHDYTQPSYEQHHGEFIEHLSVVDLLFNSGPNCEYLIRA